MNKHFYKLKHLFVKYTFPYVLSFVFIFYLFSQIFIVQAQSTNFSFKSEKLILLQENQATQNPIIVQTSKIKSQKEASSSQYVELSDKQEIQVLVSEVLVTGAEEELEDKIYQTIQTKPGRLSTHSLLKQDISAIFATGYFSSVKAVPEVTTLGVRVTFEVQQNPILKSVHINSEVLPPQVIKKAFQNQYGSILNLVRLQEGIKQVKEWYLDNGYILVQFLEPPEVTVDGAVYLEVTEGIIESVQAQFVKTINGKNFNIQNGQPIKGNIPKALIIHNFRLKAGKIFNVNEARRELRRIKRKMNLKNITLSLNSARDYKKIAIQINIEEKDTLTKLSENLQAENSQITISEEGSRINSKEENLTNYQEVLRIARSKNDLRTEIDSVYNIASIHRSLGEYSKAIDFYNRAIRLVSSNKEDSEVLNRGTQKCETFTRGTETINYCPQQKIESRDKYLIQINILLDLSDTYRSLGEYQQALALNYQGLSLINTIETQSKDNYNKENIVFLKAITTLLKSFIYSDLGEKEIAQDFVNQAQELLNNLLQDHLLGEESFNSEEDYGSLIQLSLFSSFVPILVNHDEKQLLATLLDQLLQIITTIEKPQSNSSTQFKQIADIFFEKILNLNLYIVGKSYAQLNEKQKALEIYYRVLQTLESLKISEIQPESEEQVAAINEIKDMLNLFISQVKISVLKDMGEILAEFGKKQEALDIYQQALELLQVTGEQSIQGSIFDAIGKVYHSLKKYQLALDSYNQALGIWVELGNQFAEANTRLEIAIVERDRNYLYQAKTQIETAIELIELEPPPRDTDFSSASKDEQGKFQYYISLASYFSAKQNYYDFYVDLLMRLHEQFPSHGYMVQAFQANEQSKNRSLLAILNRRDRYVSNVRNPDSSDTRDTKLADVPRLSTIQQQVLDNESVLLEYALGEEHSYLWVVSKTKIYSYKLPKRTEIEAVAQKFYDFITIPSLRIRPIKAAKVGNKLSKMLLGQVTSQLGNKRLLIVGDGILPYIPFSALPILNSGSTEPLLVSHEIVTLPSASTFAVLRNDSKSSPSPTKTLAVLADPVFGRDDERYLGKPTNSSSQLKRDPLFNEDQPSAFLLAEQLFSRLPSTRNEAEQIASLISPANRIQKFGFAASRQAVLDLELSQYRVIHFATHGILDAEKPERSGMLLSVVDEQDQLQRSLLSTPDVFNLELSAYLVVLSGCRTGLGKQIKGEGLVGLTGGLMYAGAERVVVSLWSVEDQATAAFMSQFYQGVLKKNLPPAKALREAQLKIMKQPHWQNPYYWAAFTLQGEWN